MGSPSSKAACAEKIARLQSNIADMERTLARARINKDKAWAAEIKGSIARTKAQIASLRAHMKTLK